MNKTWTLSSIKRLLKIDNYTSQPNCMKSCRGSAVMTADNVSAVPDDSRPTASYGVLLLLSMAAKNKASVILQLCVTHLLL